MRLALAFLLSAIFILGNHNFITASPYIDSDDGIPGSHELIQPFNQIKRSCIPRGGNCDQRPNDCCHNSSCRCNLWGSNCRCQRMGLFQKWG